MFVAFFKCLRPKQWIKNLLLFAGILFAGRWNDAALVINVLVGFLVFCALSGVVYITNDILDVEKDREHPKKRLRPIASGAISANAAAAGGLVLLAGALAAAWWITPSFFICSVIYVLLVTAYSFKLKHMVILDIMVLAMGFVVRAMAGIEALHEEALKANPVAVTPYFILTTLFLALFLAIAKRRNELVILGDGAGAHRQVLNDYSTEFCDVILTVATTGVIFSYALWATSGAFQVGGALARQAGSPAAPAGAGDAYSMAFTMPFVLYGIFRYLWLVFKKDEGGAPEVVLLTDKPLLATVFLWMVTVVAILYRNS
ncbi:MAG TPA: decaprenyl-phosphate phosphoribosyltransferase [Candidatus Sumerlaeota bacterium]|nr:decaprenyl-phosphate phosphoribosyltransferase [Candidatus Sumerlaeota bacterium]